MNTTILYSVLKNPKPVHDDNDSVGADADSVNVGWLVMLVGLMMMVKRLICNSALNCSVLLAAANPFSLFGLGADAVNDNDGYGGCGDDDGEEVDGNSA